MIILLSYFFIYIVEEDGVVGGVVAGDGGNCREREPASSATVLIGIVPYQVLYYYDRSQSKGCWNSDRSVHEVV